MASQFLPAEAAEELGVLTPEVKRRLAERLDKAENGSNGSNGHGENAADVVETGVLKGHNQSDAPACASCGWIMTRSGTCYRCENCGSTSGCS